MLKHLQTREDWSEKSLGAKGFTLIELLVVIIILGILAAVAIFAVGSINDRAKANACKTENGTVQTAAEAYNAQAGAYPTTVALMRATQNLTVNGQPVTILPQLKSDPSYWMMSSQNGGPADGSVTTKTGVTLPNGC